MHNKIVLKLFKFLKEKNYKIFILGCQRSGTTLLRLILDSHNQIYCYGEINGYNYFSKNKKIKHRKKIEAFQLPIWTELFLEYECIKKYMKKDDKILFVFRDPKSVISSMKKMKRKKDQVNYIEYEISKHVKTWVDDESRSFKKYKKFLEEDPSPINQAIYYWIYKNECMIKMIEKKLNVLPIDYDELVSCPREELKKVTNFLEIDWDENLLSHHLIKHDEVINNMAMGNTKANRKIDKNSINLWKEILTKEEAIKIENKTKDLFLKLKSYV